MASSRCCTLVLIALISFAVRPVEPAQDFDDNLAEESIVDSEISSNSYVLPKQIFNDGKPFYLEKNPVSGALDFNTKKTSGLSSPNALEPQADKDITLNHIRTPNFHDFLNLPVKYTSSKFVYPLVSSSYANLKYQGNNKNFISNHKNGTAPSSTTSSSPNSYYSNIKKDESNEHKPYVSKETSTLLSNPNTSDKSTTTTQTTTQATSPSTTSTTTTTTASTTSSTTDAPTTTTTQELPTTNKPPQFTRPPLKYTTNKYKYSTIRKRPQITMESSEPLITKEYLRPTPPTTEFHSSKSPYTPLAFRPLPIKSTFTTREPADVYANMPTTTTSRPPPKKKDPNDMSLSELFNSLLDEDDEDIPSTTVNTIETTTAFEDRHTDRNVLTPFDSVKPFASSESVKPYANSESVRPFGSSESVRPTQNSESARPHQSEESSRPNNDQKQSDPNQSAHNDRPVLTLQSLRPSFENVRPLPPQAQVRPTNPSDSGRPSFGFPNQIRPSLSSESLRPHQLSQSSRPSEHVQNQQSAESSSQEGQKEDRPIKHVPFFKQETNSNETSKVNNQTNVSHHTQEPFQQQDSTQFVGLNQIERVEAKPVSTQNTITFTNNPNSVVPAPEKQTNPPTKQIQTNPETDPDTFNFGIGFNVPMQPQGFAMRHTTPSPMTPPRVQITEEKLFLRPEMSGTGVRFPVRDNFENAPIVTGTYKNDINGHGAPPMALPQNGNGLVVFPSNRQQITATVGSDLPAVSMDTSNLVSFDFDKTPTVDGSVLNADSAPNTVKFVNIPLSPSGQPEEVFQVPIQAQMNYPMTAGLTAPALPPTQFTQESGSRPPGLNRLHLTPQQKQQIHQHAIQAQRNQQIQQQKQQQQQQQIQQQQKQQQQHHAQPQPHFTQQDNEPQLDLEQRPPAQPNQPNNQQQPSRFNPNEPPRKPAPGSIQRPVIGDRLLPNILPQFRPNAKIGYGPNAYHKEGPENMRPKPQFNNLNRRIQPNLQRPQFRRPQSPAGSAQVPPPPNSFNSKMAPVQPPSGPEEPNNPNRRYFQVRPNNNERVYNIYPPHQQGPMMLQHPPLNQPLRRFVDGYQPAPRNPAVHEENSAGLENAQPPQSVEIDESLESNKRWPSPVDQKTDTAPKLEPVVTLQQLQHQKLLQKDGQEQFSSNKYVHNPDAPVAVHSASDKPPVYVVYPVKTSPLKLEVVVDKTADDAVVVGHRGEQPPLPPTDINANPAGNEYQNTPFTVIRQEQKPILVVKPKLKFPYPLQRPSADHLINIQPPSDNHPDQYDETSYNIGEEPASIAGRVVNHGPVSADADEDYEINTKMTRNTDRPIAIAYTPTEPSRYHDGPDRFSSANYASSVISEIREGVTLGADQSALLHHRRPINEDTDEFGNPSRGEDYKQEFQAPFYPSVNLDKAPDAVRNSWAVVTPPSAYASHNQIDRSDNDVEENDRSDKPSKVERPVTISSKLDSSSSGSTTAHLETASAAPFNPDKFQPEFQGGFKPIYPPGLKQAAADSEEASSETHAKGSNANIEALVYEDLGDEKEESTTSI